MARYRLTVEAASITSITAKLKSLGIEASVEKVEVPESRADRLGEAEGNVEDAKSTVEELRDELQSWRDNLPENLQNGEKASQLDEAISALEDIQSNLDQVDFSSVEFPSMF